MNTYTDNGSNADITQNETQMHEALAKAFAQVPKQFRDAVKTGSLTCYRNKESKQMACARVRVTMSFFANSEQESAGVRY
jgi:hypothetical protein